MTPNPRSAEAWAAEIFGVAIEHVTQAPKYCGDGIDGACLRGDCLIIAAVPILRAYARTILRAYARRVGEAVREKAAHLVENYDSDAFGQIRAKDKLLAGEHVSGIAAAIRQIQVKTP